MQTDLLLDPFGGRWADLHLAALEAEASGFDGLWTWDHLAGAVHHADRVLECWTLLSALAATVPRVTVGPLVLNVANRQPYVLATMAATLQELAGGRLVVGLGAGGGLGTPYAAEQDLIGQPVTSDAIRRRQVVDAVAAMREVWADREHGFLRPDPPPPIVIGAFGPKMAEVAGRVADGINTPAARAALPAMLTVARQAHEASERAAEPFLATVFAELDDRWLGPNQPERRRLEDLGVDRVILRVSAPYDRAVIRRAGELLPQG